MPSLTCRFCGRKLRILDRWRPQYYCSVECKQSFEHENARLAVEWLSELNPAKSKQPEPRPPRPELDDDFPEPDEPGFVAQPLPVGSDCTILPAGFPAAQPCVRPSRRNEETHGVSDRIPEHVAMAHEVKRLSRAIWLCPPMLEETGPDSYLRRLVSRSSAGYRPGRGHADPARCRLRAAST